MEKFIAEKMCNPSKFDVKYFISSRLYKMYKVLFK